MGLTRRQVIAGLLALPLVGIASRADARGIKVTSIQKGKRGVTLTLQLGSAPFPFPSKRWKDDTVLVFVPHHHRVIRKDKRVDMVVHFHGHNTTAREAMENHQLREQLADSKQNAILAIPQLPVDSGTGHPGKLTEKGGLVRMLTDIRKALQTKKVRKALGRARLHRRSRIGTLILSAHSGGYWAAAECLDHGGFEVSEVYLFDSLYGNLDEFYTWLMEADDHKLIAYYSGGKVAKYCRRFMRKLDDAKFKYLHEQKEGQLSRADITLAQAVFIGTVASHRGVTHKYNELRDCLYASSLKRRLKSRWFDRKRGPRPLVPRK
jgi:hypothetical protein